MRENQLTTPKSGLPVPENIRLYLDQMFQTHVARVLRETGYDVIRASEVGRSRADDRLILKKAIHDNRILVTLDEHFGDWVVLPLHRHPGVIRIKANPAAAGNILAILLPFLQRLSSDNIRNHLVILSSNHEKWVCTDK
jgi:predicted nuclease of predicted toxin-antitoxin system